MSEVTTSESSAQAAQGGAQTSNGSADSEVSPAKRAYDGILGELKGERQKRRELEEKMQAIEAERLLEAGKLKEYAETMKTRAQKLEEELRSAKQNFAFTTVKSQIERKASELGCLDSDLLIKAIDMDKVQVDDAFTVDSQSLTEVLENVRKTKPFLFRQEGAKFKDANPSSAVAGKPDLSKMNKQEILALAKQMGVR